MRGFFVPGRVFRRPVDFDKNEPCGVFQMLNHIESRNARFQNTVAGIFQGCLLKFFDAVGLDMDKDVDDKHGILHNQSVGKSEKNI